MKVRFVAKPAQIIAQQYLPGLEVEGVFPPDGQMLDPHTINCHGVKCPVYKGDWIIPEPSNKEGETPAYYPCRSDVFDARYNLLMPNGEQKPALFAIFIQLGISLLNDMNEEAGSKFQDLMLTQFESKDEWVRP